MNYFKKLSFLVIGIAAYFFSNSVSAQVYRASLGVTPDTELCEIERNSQQTSCSFIFDWEVESDEMAGTASSSRSLKVNGDEKANSSGIGNYSSSLQLEIGTWNYELVPHHFPSANQGTITVRYKEYVPDFSYSPSTHNPIVGDFDGNGEQDVYHQPKNNGVTGGIIPQDLNAPLIQNLHRSWNGQHPDITQIKDWSAESYAAFSANLSNSSGDELLLLGHKDIILLHGDIVTPITLLNDVRNAIVSWDQNGNATYTTFEFDADPDNYKVYFGDLNGDGYSEIILQGKTKGSSVHILNRNGSLRQTIASGYKGLDWSASTYDFEIVDINNDGRADIKMLSKVSGVPDNFAYSNASGIIDNVDAAYHQSETPKAATLVGSTGGEFRVSESGGATYSIGISTPSGTAGVTPQISLNYSSSSGNGVLGVGWSVGGLSSVHRCAKNMAQNDGEITAITNTNDDVFCIDGQQLFVKSGGANTTEYRTEIFSNDTIKSFNTDGDSDNGPEYFTVKTRDGDTKYYGKYHSGSDNALVKATHNSANRLWLLDRIEDIAGNYIQYKYGLTSGGAESYLDKILYTGNDEQNLTPYNEIDFVYASDLNSQFERSDQTQGYSGGSKVAMTKLLKQVKTYNNSNHLKTYQIYHQVSQLGEKNLVKAVQECSYLGNCFEPVVFEWSDAGNAYSETGYYLSNSPLAGFLKAFDIDGSGISDTLVWKNNKVYLSVDFGSQQHDVGLNISQSEFLSIKPIDLSADGVVDLISYTGDTWRRWIYSKYNKTFSQRGIRVSDSVPASKLFVVDLDGDGRQDLLDLSSSSARWYRQGEYPGTDNICVPGDPNPPVCEVPITYFFPETPQTVTFSSGNVTARSSGLMTARNIETSTRFSDFNGDGITDLLVEANSVVWDDSRDLAYNHQNPPSQTSSGIFAFVFDPVDQRFETFGKIGGSYIENIVPYDINSDGLTDLLYVMGDVWHYRINRGGLLGFASPLSTGIPAEDEDDNDRVIVLDYDNDGKAELWTYGSNSLGSYYNLYQFNDSTFSYLTRVSDIPTDPVVVYADLYGKGNTDLIMAAQGSSTWKRLKAPSSSDAPTPHLLTNITSAYGVQTDIDYKPLTDSSVYTQTYLSRPEYPVIQMTTAMPVVSLVTSDTGIASQRVSVSYQYQDFQAHLSGRGVLGFKKLITKDEQSGIVTETEYEQNFPFTGYPKQTTRKIPKTIGATVLSRATNTWEQKVLQGQVFAYLEESRELNWSLASDSTPNVLTDDTAVFINQVITTNTYNDNYGNLTKAEIVNTNSQASDRSGETQWFKTVSINDYGSSVWEKKYARLKSVSVTKTRSDTTDPEVEKSTFSYYPESQAHNGTQFSGFAGMLRTETVHPDNEKYITKEYAYDSFGNKTKETVKAKSRNSLTLVFGSEEERSTTTTYDAKGRHVESVANDLGHTETYTYESRFGAVATQIGPNGLTTSFKYNETGTKYETKGVDGAYAREYLLRCGTGGAGCPSGAKYYSESIAYDAAGNAMSGYSREFFNKLGQKIVTTKEAFVKDGLIKNIVNRIEYDKFGRVLKGYMPTFGNADTVDTRYTLAKYDALGRVYEEVAPGLRSTTKQYSGLTTTITNAIGQVTIETKNINGDLLSVTDNSAKTITYVYNSKGEFTKLIDSSGNDIINTIDDVGHKTQMVDPDKGTWQYRYNGFGELIQQIDARGVVIAQEYDQLGRMLRRIDNAAVGNHQSVADIDVQTTCWVYDNAPMGTQGVVKGALHKTLLYPGQIDCTDPGTVIPLQEKISGYDALGRAETATQKIKSEDSNNIETYMTMTSYEESSSRVEFTILPEEVTLKNHYDALGNLIKITDGNDETKVYHLVSDVDKFGNVVDETIGYGAGAVPTSKAYDQNTGFLESIIAGQTGSELIKLKQGFDLLGNVRSRKDYIADRHEVFEYTEGSQQKNLLNRLTKFKVSTIGGTPATAKSYSYDELGNLTSKSDMGDEYRYGTTTGIHAVTSIHNQNVLKRTFGYDDSGNLTSDVDHANSANNRIIRYGAFEKAVYIKKGISNPSEITFRYGSGRERYRRIDNVYENGQAIEVETTYFGSYEKVVHTWGANNGKTEHKYYIAGVALKIDTETAGSSTVTSKLRYLHKDHLGSIVAVSDESGNAVERFRYDPFGKQYKVEVSNVYTETSVTAKLENTDRGFTGHEMLSSVDIIHMNGRIYDANIGRFLQADSFIQAPKNMQSMNRYSYVLNNPLSYTDPSGHFFKSLKKYWRQIASIALNIWLCGGGCGFFEAVGAGALSGAVATGSLKGALTGAFSAGLLHGIGTHFQNLKYNNAQAAFDKALIDGKNIAEAIAAGAENFALTASQQISKVLSHAVAGGIMAKLGGGHFGNGFAAAGVTQAFSKSIDNLSTSEGRILSASMVGGTASVISGGKFANGAVTAAFSRVFNEEGEGHSEESFGEYLLGRVNNAITNMRFYRGFTIRGVFWVPHWDGVSYPLMADASAGVAINPGLNFDGDLVEGMNMQAEVLVSGTLDGIGYGWSFGRGPEFGLLWADASTISNANVFNIDTLRGGATLYTDPTSGFPLGILVGGNSAGVSFSWPDKMSKSYGGEVFNATSNP